MASNSIAGAVAANMPRANAKAEQQRKAAADLQMQEAIAAAPAVGGNIQKTAQQLGTVMAQEQGKQQVAQVQQQVGQQTKLADNTLQQQAAEQKQDLAGRNIELAKVEQQDVQKLASLSSRAKTEMFDSRMKFEQDEIGRKMFNERQTADYIRMKTSSDVEFKLYAQKAKQAGEREIQTLEYESAVLQQALKESYNSDKADRDRLLETELKTIIDKRNKQIAEAKQKFKSDMAVWGVVAKGAGIVASIYGGPAAGAAAEAGVMGIGSNVTKEEDYLPNDQSRKDRPVYNAPSEQNKK